MMKKRKMPNHSTHRKIIRVIHETWSDGAPFAIWEVRDATHVSTSSVVRTVVKLRGLRLLVYTKRAYANRHYRVAPRWPAAVKDAIENFELAKILGM